MKKLILSIFFIIATVLYVDAQTFELTWHGEVLGDTVVISDVPTANDMTFDPIVTNLSNSNIKVKVRRNEISIVDSTANYFCWVACYAPFVNESGEFHVMAPGASTDQDFFYAHYTPLNQSGTSIIEYMFYNMDDESQNLKVVVKYKTSVQLFKLTWDGETLGDVISIVSDTSVPEMIFNPIVTNNTTAAINVKVRRTNLDVVAGSENYFCWVLCYEPANDISSEFLEMAPGASSGLEYFSGHYTPLGHSGTSAVEYMFYDMNDVSINQKFIVKYTSSPTAIDESILKGVHFSAIYPNPAINFVSLNYTLVPGVKSASIRISNILGTVVSEMNLNLNSNSTRVDVSQLDGGIYFYSVILNGERLSTKKLVIR
ncbi:MAG: hypothetical protein A2W85_02190 [Bacteroidetes bacterium GWF2_41_31]|nr:MAG: hypothetical protein A2W85_02190 [Bacteroidetes bacterium GWF2_41_31]